MGPEWTRGSGCLFVFLLLLFPFCFVFCLFVLFFRFCVGLFRTLPKQVDGEFKDTRDSLFGRKTLRICCHVDLFVKPKKVNARDHIPSLCRA